MVKIARDLALVDIFCKHSQVSFTCRDLPRKRKKKTDENRHYVVKKNKTKNNS